MIRIVTSFSHAMWDDYVHRTLPRNMELWPAEWQVWLDDRTNDHGLRNVRYLTDDPDHEAFMEQWNNILLNNETLDRAITEERFPTNYTQDAGTFCHKVFAMTNHEARKGCDWLIWLGADVEITEAITADWLDKILRADIVHLGRKDMRASETEFLAFHLDNDMFSPANRFLNALRYIYTSGDLFKWAEWTDAHIIGRMCAVCEGLGYNIRNLSQNRPGLDVWPETILGERMIHYKGNKKEELKRAI